MSNSKRAKNAPPPTKNRHWATRWLIAVVAVAAIGLGAFGIMQAFGGGSSSAKAVAQPQGHSLSQAIQDHATAASGLTDQEKAVNNGTLNQAAGVPLATPTDNFTASNGEKTGGCTVGYGKGECLPITPPSAGQMHMTVQEMPWTCSEVKTFFPQGLPVNQPGVDPAHLDGNKDGIACDNGDAG